MSRHGAPTSKWPSLTEGAEAEPERASEAHPEATLIVRRPGLPEVRLPARGGLVIGRAPALADLVLDDDLVSRKHAKLHVDPRGYFRLEDLGSRNGIQFAERTVRRLNLVDGDVFHIGKTELVFSAEMARLGSRKPEPPPRIDPLMIDTSVPVPEPEAVDDGLEGIEQLGWRPAPAGGSLEPPKPGPRSPSEAPTPEEAAEDGED